MNNPTKKLAHHQFEHAGQTFSFYAFCKVEFGADADGAHFQIWLRDYNNPDVPLVLVMRRDEFAAWLIRFQNFHDLPSLLIGSC